MMNRCESEYLLGRIRSHQRLYMPPLPAAGVGIASQRELPDSSTVALELHHKVLTVLLHQLGNLARLNGDSIQFQLLHIERVGYWQQPYVRQADLFDLVLAQDHVSEIALPGGRDIFFQHLRHDRPQALILSR